MLLVDQKYAASLSGHRPKDVSGNFIMRSNMPCNGPIWVDSFQRDRGGARDKGRGQEAAYSKVTAVLSHL